MQGSRYNIFTPCNFKEGSDVVFNPAANTLMVIPSSTARALEANDFSAISPERLEKYKERGLITDDDGALERSRLRFLHWKNKMASDDLNLTIIPTYLCNFACPYCFESVFKGLNDDANRMSEEVCDSIIKLVENQIKEGTKSIRLTWYGGEPLIAKDMIKSMTEKLITLCKENGTSYNNSIITNGYLLDEETAKMLADIEIGFMQITIDGLAERHNKTRKLKNGEGTFDKIVENIKIAHKHIKNISVRVNTGADNLDGALKVREYLKKAIPDATNISVYPAPVINTDRTYGADEDEFQRHKDEFYCENTEYERVDRLKPVYCMTSRSNGFLIDCYSQVFKCWELVGDGREIGMLGANGSIKYNQKYYDYVLYDPTEDPECKDCPHLPICMGWCLPKRQSKFTCAAKRVTADEINRKLNNEAARMLFYGGNR